MMCALPLLTICVCAAPKASISDWFCGVFDELNFPCKHPQHAVSLQVFRIIPEKMTGLIAKCGESTGLVGQTPLHGHAPLSQPGPSIHLQAVEMSS